MFATILFMNRRNIIIILIVLFIALSLAYDNIYTPRFISGTYIYHFPSAVAEGPNLNDKLTLNDDGNFESDTWGKGTYEINGSDLELTYQYELGNAGFELTIYRPMFWGEPHLYVVKDLGYYFAKVD